LFLHGFSDRLDNHGPLFAEFNRAGLRVISFDLPGHGENSGHPNDINSWNFSSLAKLAAFIEKTVVLQTKIRPASFLLSGWSTGGLIAIRIAQGLGANELSRKISGLILFAPGVAVRPPWEIGEKTPDFMNGLVGHVTVDSLTHNLNPPHYGPISPESPVTQVRFGADLSLNALLARKEDFPARIPTLVFIAGEKEDHYADSRGLKDWVSRQQNHGKSVYSVVCEEGRHELDNELAPMGDIVRSLTAEFSSYVLNHDFSKPFASSETCHF
jgi:alpha-beta hydrolase superfamily lysophospholipase